MKDLEQSLGERLLLWASKFGIDVAEAQRSLNIILYDYKIEPKEKALVVYTEGKNEVCIKKFALAKAIAGCSKRTVEQYTTTIKRFCDSIGKDADTVTSEDIQAYFAQRLVDGVSKSYVDTIRRYLSSFFAYLTKEELISKNPMTKVDKIKYHVEKETAFSDFDVENIRAACRNAREKALVELLLSTGCRASETVSIKITDIDEDKITVFGKGGKYRTVYLNAKCIVALRTYLGERKDRNPYLFAGGISMNADLKLNKKRKSVKSNWYLYPDLVDPKKHLDHESVNNCVKSIGKRAGVENVHTHRFRRTCATMALRRGMPIELVSKMLGHEQLATTQIYLDLREEDLKRAHEKLVY